jgi:hypothetical protein
MDQKLHLIMATLTEKEWDLEVSNQLKASFYAELRNGIVSDVYCILDVDGFHVTWSPMHKNGMIRVYEIGKLTNDWLRLLNLVGTESAKVIEESLKGFLNSNLTYNS